MKKASNLYYKQNPFEYIGELGVQSYPNPSGIYPYHLGPSDSLEGWQFKASYFDSPMRLSEGTWHVRSTMEIKRSNLHIVGSGYHTVFQAIPTNSSISDGLLKISGNNVIIEGVRFDDGGIVMDGLITGSSVTSLTLRGCWFDASVSTYLTKMTLADSLVIEKCVGTHTGGSGAGLYALDSDDVMIQNNRVTSVRNGVNLDSTNTAVAAQRCNEGIVVGNHVGASGIIRYNSGGSHRVLANNVNATLTTY